MSVCSPSCVARVVATPGSFIVSQSVYILETISAFDTMRFQLVKTESVISNDDFFSPSYREKEVELRDLVEERRRQRRSRLWMVLVLFFIAALVVSIIILSNLYTAKSSSKERQPQSCSDTCTVTVVESIPENLTYTKGSVQNPSIYNGWENLLADATESLDIAASYFSLRGSDTRTTDPSTGEGDKIFQGIIDAAKRGIKIRIVHSVPTKFQPDLDTQEFEKLGAAEVRTLNLQRLLGDGILHTKMWLVDKKHFYVGSANMDWRSLTQVKEIGLMTYNCSCLATDISKIFEVYWLLATPTSHVPVKWPTKYKTGINLSSPASININSTDLTRVFLASSPPQLCPPGRTSDIDSILHVINSAQEFVYIAVMDYFPSTVYTHPRKYWAVIDDALRHAAFDRGVKVRLMGSLWNHTFPDMKNYFRSLSALSGSFNFGLKVDIQVRYFKVPAFTKFQADLPYARVNHNKYMVTESVGYVGTSNWSADYFLYTGGIGYVINDTDSSGTSVRRQLQDVFERDWYSKYTMPV